MKKKENKTVDNKETKKVKMVQDRKFLFRVVESRKIRTG